MISEFEWVETLGAWIVPVFIFDLLFTGISLRLLGLAGWYKGLLEGEEVVYRRRLGGTRGGWTWGGLVLITNKRFLVKYHLSAVTLVNVPIETIREVVRGSWWWFCTVRVAYLRKDRERSIEIASTRQVKAELLHAFRFVGARVVGNQKPAGS